MLSPLVSGLIHLACTISYRYKKNVLLFSINHQPWHAVILLRGANGDTLPCKARKDHRRRLGYGNPP